MLNTDLIFNIINFIAVIFLFIYIFKKYIYSTIINLFEEDKYLIINLKTQKEEIIAQQIKSEKKYKEQERLNKELISKIEIWKNFIATENKKLEQESKIYADKIKQKLELQSKNYNFNILKQKIGAQTIKILEKDLKHYFRDKIAIEKYFNNIFNYLNNR